MSVSTPGGSTIRSVLHPTDLSAASALAFVHALKVALAGKTRMYVMHADPREREEIDWAEFPAVRQTLTGWGVLPAGSAPADVGAKLGLHLAKISARETDPARAILRFLDDHPSDLIVLATHGRDGLPRWLRGSVAEPVARQAFTQTLFIPEGARGFVAADSGAVGLRALLVPIDQRPRPDAAVEAARLLCRTLGVEDAALHLVHVGDAGSMPSVALEEAGWREVTRRTRAGDPVKEILAAATECNADLIVMATEGHHGFLDAIRGSTTERVLRHAPCPVLAVPAG